ncbi:MAG: HAMP domain-containing protein, partial [Megamonas funiformis]|uniref:sensor histidine kinase n=1 Tax=Megamonas funiformis TaxID=437897 RepID=UPI001EB360F5
YYQTRYMDKVTDTLQDQIRRFMVVCSVLIGVLIIVVAVSAVMIVSGIIQPISQLNQATEKIAQGDFNARAQADSEDEVAELAVSFNKMAGSMQSLIDKVKEDERKMRKADLRLLQEQIQPHFLCKISSNRLFVVFSFLNILKMGTKKHLLRCLTNKFMLYYFRYSTPIW